MNDKFSADESRRCYGKKMKQNFRRFIIDVFMLHVLDRRIIKWISWELDSKLLLVSCHSKVIWSANFSFNKHDRCLRETLTRLQIIYETHVLESETLVKTNKATNCVISRKSNKILNEQACQIFAKFNNSRGRKCTQKLTVTNLSLRRARAIMSTRREKCKSKLTQP